MPGRADIFRFITNSNGNKGVQNMIALARSEPGIAIVPSDLDKNPFLLGVANGTLDLKTGELRTPRREDYITKLSPVAYDANAPCDLWQQFLTKILDNDDELVGFIKRLCGYCLTGDVREQVLPILYGSGSNGKSTFLKALHEVLGDYAMKATESLLFEKAKDGHPTNVADLAGKRLAITNETRDGVLFAEARVKELTGGDTIRARRMREDNWEFAPTHKILIATNHKPPVSGRENAIWRRLKLVPFDVKIADGEQDKELANKLKAEYPGILRWMVEGCLEWQANGLRTPSRVEIATAGYRRSEDVFGTFLETCCVMDAEAAEGATELLDAYKEFTGDRSMTARKLAMLLDEHGLHRDRITNGPTRGRMARRGLRLIRE